jgi:hypothetical protein
VGGGVGEGLHESTTIQGKRKECIGPLGAIFVLISLIPQENEEKFRSTKFNGCHWLPVPPPCACAVDRLIVHM